MATRRRAAPKTRDFGAELLRVTPRDSMHDWLEERLADLPELGIRRMFGGAGIYSGDTMFGIVAKARVYFKTDDTTRPAFVERGMEPFRASARTVLKSYYEIPAEVLDGDAELLEWARRALDVARRAPATSRARSARRRGG